MVFFVFFFKQKTAYEMRSSDWSSDVCSSDLGDVGAGEFQREFGGSYGTHIVGDLGVTYYGKVKDASDGGAAQVSEYSSIEEVPETFADADYITYTRGTDGKISPEVQDVLDSKMWKNLPAVKARKSAEEGKR